MTTIMIRSSETNPAYTLIMTHLKQQTAVAFPRCHISHGWTKCWWEFLYFWYLWCADWLWCLACIEETHEWHIMECVAACREEGDAIADIDSSWNDIAVSSSCQVCWFWILRWDTAWMTNWLTDWHSLKCCLRQLCWGHRFQRRCVWHLPKKMRLTPSKEDASDTLQLEWELRRWYHRRPWENRTALFHRCRNSQNGWIRMHKLIWPERDAPGTFN